MQPYGSLRVVALVRDVEWACHIRDALGRSSIIRWIQDGAELHHIAGLASANIVLWHLEPRLDSSIGMLATLRRIRIAMPTSTVVLFCPLTREIARILLIAGRFGVDRVALRGYDDLARVVNDALLGQRHATAIEIILSRLDLTQSRLAPVLARVIRRAFDAPCSVEELARELGVDRKTLHNRLRAAGLPSPAVLISWSRLFAAGWLLDDPAHSVASVARALGFTSVSELRGMLARYLHARASDLRRQGALNAILDAFRAASEDRLQRSVGFPTDI